MRKLNTSASMFVTLSTPKKLGYFFQSVDIPWLKAPPKPHNKSKKSIAASIVPFGVGAALAEPKSIQDRCWHLIGLHLGHTNIGAFNGVLEYFPLGHSLPRYLLNN
ncbi:polyphenol oxidase [Cucumis melo var. makuwa]|uniref:Polyphenol oxidase n=2 Tax=Cucumis melo TaxID=3656 RepID=A0A5D3CEU3_CUCMM|nr:polyphenol oxidase [Cucumis melo var. makuwa]TYK09748.1 polyphenol oxidase [Cucumis melo var. makuwa]